MFLYIKGGLMNNEAINENDEQEQSLNEEKENLIEEYLKNSEYHLKQYKQYKAGESQFNFVAFFFSPVWLLLEGLILHGIILLFCFFILDSISIHNFLIVLLLCIYIGLKGNSIYYTHVENKVDAIMKKYTTHDERIKNINRSRNFDFICGLIIYGFLIVLERTSYFIN